MGGGSRGSRNKPKLFFQRCVVAQDGQGVSATTLLFDIQTIGLFYGQQPGLLAHRWVMAIGIYFRDLEELTPLVGILDPGLHAILVQLRSLPPLLAASCSSARDRLL